MNRTESQTVVPTGVKNLLVVEARLPHNPRSHREQGGETPASPIVRGRHGGCSAAIVRCDSRERPAPVGACFGGSASARSGISPGPGRVSGGVGRLRAYGNAIVAQVAAEFVGAFMDWQESAA